MEEIVPRQRHRGENACSVRRGTTVPLPSRPECHSLMQMVCRVRFFLTCPPVERAAVATHPELPTVVVMQFAPRAARPRGPANAAALKGVACPLPCICAATKGGEPGPAPRGT